MYNVYDGTLGMMVDTNKITNAIVNYMINNQEPLNYEIKELDGIKIVAILGKNEYEKKIPMFQQPLIFKDMRSADLVIALDFRLYVKSKLEDVLNIGDVLQDKYNGDILMNRAIFTEYIIKDDVSFLMGINANIAYSFASFMTGVLTTLVYDKTIYESVMLASMLHYYNLDVNNGDIKSLINKLPTNELKSLMHGDNKQYYNKLINLVESEDYDLSNDSISTLLTNIQVLSDNNRLKGVNEDMLISSLSRGFYTNNSKEMAIAVVENKATLLAMVYAVMTTGINSKSVLRTIINNNKHNTKPKDIVHNLKTLIEDSLDII